MTGEALYTDDLAGALPGTAACLAGSGASRACAAASSRRRAGAREPGVVATLTAADVPGEGDSGANRHDEPLFPVEIMHHPQPVAWVLGETLEAATTRSRARASGVRALTPMLTIQDAIAAGSYHSGPFAYAARRCGQRDCEPARYQLIGELSIGGQEHFYLETQCALARMDETGGIIVDSSTQHPCETQEVSWRACSGIPCNQVYGAMPAHGRCVRRQGSAGQSVGGDRGARRLEDAASGARAFAALIWTWR